MLLICISFGKIDPRNIIANVGNTTISREWYLYFRSRGHVSLAPSLKAWWGRDIVIEKFLLDDISEVNYGPQIASV
jgi:hypothetical protein